MIVNTISLDSSGKDSDGRALRSEVDQQLGGTGDPLYILIRLESAAERRLRMTRDLVTDDLDYINRFINSNIY